MQPTSLVKSKTVTEHIDYNGFLSSSAQSGAKFRHALKTLAWASTFGSVFLLTQSYALSLQNIQINSALGEPLDAIVRVNAAPGEVLQASCMRATPNAESGMPAIRGIQLSLTRKLSPGTIRLSTSRPVTEPMSEVVLQIECPGAPAVKRSFLVMLDPRGLEEGVTSPSGVQSNAGTAQVFSSENPASAQTANTRPLASEFVNSSDNRINVRSRQVTVFRGVPIDPGSTYTVVNGDALSTIAARVEGRDYGTVWSWAATIQAANPHAFINGNPNELIAGSQVYIPNALAAGTAGLTVPEPSASQTANAAEASGAPTRYLDRFSTTTGESAAAIESPQNPAPESPAESGTAPAVAVVPRQAVAAGSIRAIQPVMVMATSFSSVSRERLRQRQRGLIQSAPNNLPNFAAAEAANDAPAQEGTPAPQDNRTPLEPAVVKPESAVNTGSRFSWLTALGGLALLLSTFFAGWWLSRRRADAELEEQLEARLNEERYRERVRSGRQDVIRAGMGRAGTGIQVTETASQTREVEALPQALAEPREEPRQELSEDDLDEVIGAALADDNTPVAHTSNTDATDPAPVDEGPMIDPEELEMDTRESHELAEIDLELLERDYATQTETNTGLEEIAAAGKGKDKKLADAELGMEFPEDLKIKRESQPAFDTLEFDPRDAEVDFDIGATTAEVDNDKTEALGLDLEEAGASIEAHLEELKRADEEYLTQSLDETSEVEMQDLESEINDLMIDKLIDDDDEMTADPEEFYHLEASSIMNVGELDFEKGPDDETNILRFRQRNIRTGTDDSSGEED